MVELIGSVNVECESVIKVVHGGWFVVGLADVRLRVGVRGGSVMY